MNVQSSSHLKAAVQLDVAILVETEVLLRGLTSLLTQISRVTIVGQRELPSVWPERDHDPARLIIATLPEWKRIAANDLTCGGSRPLVLLIGEDIHSRDISLPGDLPCDGVISLAETTVPTLDDTLRRAVLGEMPMPAGLARELLAASRGKLRQCNGHSVAFTSREKETLSLLAQGYSNKQIAKSLGISAHGVKRLVGAILLKLGAPNRTTAVIMAMNEGLV
ncbi:helix-turn-helix transcriptional regulator [Streptomyces silvisoli]|uniref:LuxR C-terminal-related transcriptional regulator n=1 Tax=Streptomyces silvisoli TaxID=3034235 RepID=A0ABT5ZS67_9ACTN|nr:LuxR C-terminal-related transcriptional regulator [Streptomyces silvisoli]MDF3292651.1 LuxR C-terminal-related transcriptional regulator [Streptomyces silvisoli]